MDSLRLAAITRLALPCFRVAPTKSRGACPALFGPLHPIFQEFEILQPTNKICSVGSCCEFEQVPQLSRWMFAVCQSR